MGGQGAGHNKEGSVCVSAGALCACVPACSAIAGRPTGLAGHSECGNTWEGTVIGKALQKDRPSAAALYPTLKQPDLASPSFDQDERLAGGQRL